LAEVLSPGPVVAATLGQGGQENDGNSLVDQANAEQLLAELDSLSDEEVDSLLSRMLQEENGHAGLMDGVGQQAVEHMLVELDSLSDQPGRGPA
jgi:hypothetical protein